MEELFYGQQRTPLQQDMSLAVTPDPVLNPGPKTVSAAKVFGVAAKHNLGGAAGGLGGGVLGGALAGAALTGPAAPVGAVIGGLVGGLGGGMLGTKLQEAVDPTYDEDAKFLAEQAEAHKTALILGSLAPNAVAFRPSLSVMKQLASVPGQLRGLPRATLGETFGNLTAGQRAAMGNVALGGVFGAVPTAGKMVTGQPIDPEEAAYEIAAGLALHQPWGVGRMMGMHPIQSPDVEPGNIFSPAIRESISQKAAAQETAKTTKKPGAKNFNKVKMTPENFALDEAYSQESPLSENILLNKGVGYVNSVQDKTGNPEYTPAVKTDSGKVFVSNSHGESFTAAKNAGETGGRTGFVTSDNEFLSLMDVARREMVKQSSLSQQSPNADAFPPGDVRSKEGVNLPEGTFTKSERALAKELTGKQIDEPTFKKNTAAYYDKQRLAKFAETPDKPWAGKFTEREAGNEPAVAERGAGWNADTDFHEQSGHGMQNDLARSANPFENQLQRTLETTAATDKDYLVWKAEVEKSNAAGNTPVDPSVNEYLARELGNQHLMKILKEPGKWTPEDFAAAKRVKAGKASLDDLVRYTNNYQQHGPDYLTSLQRSGGKYGPKMYAGEPQKSEESPLDVKDLEPDDAIQKALEWYYNPQVKESYKAQFAGLPEGTVREKVSKLQAETIKSALPSLTAEQVDKFPKIVGAAYKGKSARRAREAEAQGADLVANEQQKEADSLVVRNWKPVDEQYKQIQSAAREIAGGMNSSRKELPNHLVETVADNATAQILNGKLGTRRTEAGNLPVKLKVKPGDEGFVQHLIDDHLQTAVSREYDAQSAVENGNINELGKNTGDVVPTASLDELRRMGLDVNERGRLGKESAAESVEAENAGAETALREGSAEDVAAGISIEKLETPFKPSKELKSLLYGAQDHLYGKTGNEKEQAAFAKKFLFDENGIQSDFLDALREKDTPDSLRYHDELIKELADIESNASYNKSVPAPTTFVDFVGDVIRSTVAYPKNIANSARELEHFADRVYNDKDSQVAFIKKLPTNRLKEFNAFMTDQRAVMRRRILAIEDQQSGSMKFPKVLRVKGEKVTVPRGEPSFESIMPDEPLPYEPEVLSARKVAKPAAEPVERSSYDVEENALHIDEPAANDSVVQDTEVLPRPQRVHERFVNRSPEESGNYSSRLERREQAREREAFNRNIAVSQQNAKWKKVERAQEQFSVQSPLDNPEFKRWFGESKVVDEQGKPLQVYHASDKAFNVFNAGSHFGTKNQAGNKLRVMQEAAFWQKPENRHLRSNDLDAQFTKETSADGSVYPVYLNIKNPKRVSDVLTEENWAAEISKAKNEGYDGIVYRNNYETDGDYQSYLNSSGPYADSYIAFHPEQIKSATGNSGSFDSSNPDIRYSVQSIVPDVLKATADKVERQFPEVGGAYKKAKESEGLLRGKLVDGPVQRIIKLMPLYRPEGRGWKAWVNDFLATDSPDNRAVVEHRRALMAGENPAPLKGKAAEINSIVDDVIEQSALETEKRTGLDIERIPGYLGDVVSNEAMDTLTKDPTGKKADDIREDAIAYWRSKGASEERINNALGEFFGGFGKDKPNRAEQFGPVDKSHGLGLPPSIRSDNLLDILSRTGRRYATRLAYMDHFENSPDTMAALKKAAPHKQVQLLMDDLNGVREDVEGTRMAIAGVIRAGMMQTMTGVNDFVTTFPLGMRHMAPEQTLKAFAGGLRDIRKNWQESFEMGVNRSNLDNLQMSEDGMTNIETTLNTARNVMNRVTGRNFFEQAARSFAYSTGKVLAWDAAHGGSSLGNMKEKFVKDFFPEGKASTDPEIIKQAAKRYVESVQGTYTYQGLPEISQKGSLAPYLSLSRWNIEQLNNFDRHVFKPALEGNYMPLAMATLGMVIGGKAVEEIRQVVMNRKSKLPTASEILESEQPIKGTMYKAAGLAALAGYAGFYGDLARGAADLAIGNRPQEMNNPLLQGMGDGLGLATKYMTALADGQPVQAMELFHQFVTTYLQGARILNNQVSGEEMTKADKFRDLRVFKQLNHGELPPAGSETPNPFMRPKERRFKQTEDLSEAVGLAPELISEAIDANNPEQTETNLRRIKSNSYQTMPSPEHRPGEFTKFRDYLERTQGADEASERTTDYLRRNAINKAKSTMIP